MGETLGILAIVFLLVIIILTVWVSINNDRKSDRVWRELASRTRLDYTPRTSALFGMHIPGWLNGSYRGRKMSLTRIEEKGPDWADEYTKIWVQVTVPITGKLSLSPKTWWRSRGNETEDDEIDDRFVVSSDPIELASHLFASTYLRRSLLEGPSLAFEISEVKSGIESIVRTAPNEVDYWQSVIDLLCDVADAFEGKASPY
jgi:hypothetical protein